MAGPAAEGEFFAGNFSLHTLIAAACAQNFVLALLASSGLRRPGEEIREISLPPSFSPHDPSHPSHPVTLLTPFPFPPPRDAPRGYPARPLRAWCRTSVSGTLRVPLPGGTRSVPDTFWNAGSYFGPNPKPSFPPPATIHRFSLRHATVGWFECAGAPQIPPTVHSTPPHHGYGPAAYPGQLVVMLYLKGWSVPRKFSKCLTGFSIHERIAFVSNG